MQSIKKPKNLVQIKNNFSTAKKGHAGVPRVPLMDPFHIIYL